jgi:Na+-transporting methylmalonyl-CoA/oxaloacetate decarboxylase gamma subunit
MDFSRVELLLMQGMTIVFFAISLYELVSHSVSRLRSTFKHLKIVIETKSGKVTLDPDNEESVRALIKKFGEGESENVGQDVQEEVQDPVQGLERVQLVLGLVRY